MQDYKSRGGSNTVVLTKDDLAPPPYDDAGYQYHHHMEPATALLPPPSALSSTSTSSSSTPSSSGSTIRFPQRLVYVPSWVSTTSFIGRTKNEPLFAVETPSKLVNCFGLGKTVLHAGAHKASPAVASVGVERGSKFRRSLIRVGGGDEHGDAPVEVSMSGDWGRTHGFSLRVGGDDRTEAFEWRHSHGDEVRALSGGFNTGWKLVRLDSPPIPPWQDRAGRSYTSDGKEVVAVAAQPRLFHRSPEFTFVGTGATGELGETFEIVAVMGFLRLFELSVQQSTANAAAASSSSAAVAVS